MKRQFRKKSTGAFGIRAGESQDNSLLQTLMPYGWQTLAYLGSGRFLSFGITPFPKKVLLGFNWLVSGSTTPANNNCITNQL